MMEFKETVNNIFNIYNKYFTEDTRFGCAKDFVLWNLEERCGMKLSKEQHTIIDKVCI